MAKAHYERTKPHVNIGTIGHVDHGKTTLTVPTAISPTKRMHTAQAINAFMIRFLLRFLLLSLSTGRPPAPR